MVNICVTIGDSEVQEHYIMDGIYKDGKWQIEYINRSILICTGSINTELLNRMLPDAHENIMNYNHKSILSVTECGECKDNPKFVKTEIPELILYILTVRYVEYIEYLKTIDYIIASSKIKSNISPYSDLLQIATAPFNFTKFSKMFPLFNEFLERSREFNLMISGSSVLYSLDNIELNGRAADVDIYIHKNENQIMILKKFDKMIRDIYNKPFILHSNNNMNEKRIDRVKIYLIRSPYILSWLIVDDSDSVPEFQESQITNNMTDRIIISYQIILSPCSDWSHVFSGYHSDIVCAGYLTKEQQFVETPNRFLRWYNGNIYKNIRSFFSQDEKFPEDDGKNLPKLAYFFPDFVSPRYRDRVETACIKYRSRGIETYYVSAFDDVIMMDVARSIPFNEKYLNNYNQEDGCANINPSIISMLKKEGITCISESLASVYHGEKFRTIIETMSCFQECPACGILVFNSLNSLYCDEIRNINDRGCFCSSCFQKEVDKMKELQDCIKSLDSNNIRALVTGGRCGIGQRILELFKTNGLTNSFGTTRFPNKENNLIRMDLQDPNTWTEVKFMLENGEINYLILSASETLHYPDDVNLSKNFDKVTMEVDWTNDFKRPNSGIWHKTLKQHNYNEIVSPLMCNVVGNAALLGYFMTGVQKMRSIGNDQQYCCIIVTSYEGSFNEKTPFHPITNASKAALEQIVHTVKAEADFLDCNIVLADPGWVYTEGSFGKLKGPVPIDFGACQILQPLVHSIKNNMINGQTFRRSEKQMCDY